MNADRYFSIGRLHPICQDYALVANWHGQVAAFLSDGCSTSPGTDFGSRFLCLAAAKELADFGYPGLLAESMCGLYVIRRAGGMAQICGLPTRCLDATLLIARIVRQEVLVSVWGDGVVAGRRRDGTVTHTVITAPAGAPDYLSYMLDPERHATYMAEINGCKTCQNYEGGEPHAQWDVEPFTPVELSYDLEEFDLVSLVSDGAESFQRMEGGRAVGVPTHQVVEQLMAVKNISKEFVVRRVRNGFLGRYCPKMGWQHYDDLAVATIALGKRQKPNDTHKILDDQLQL